MSLQTLRIGVLFSSTGTMKETELPLLAFALFYLEHLKGWFTNSGYDLQILHQDCESSSTSIRRQVEWMEKQGCRVFLGPYTSVHRKAAQSAMTGSMLLYPVQYEGFDRDGKTFFFGSTPNQQLVPLLRWFASHGDQISQVSFIGSDYIYPRMIQAILHELAGNSVLRSELGLVGRFEIRREAIVPFDNQAQDDHYVEARRRAIDGFVTDICQRGTDRELIVNAINGIDNEYFFATLHGRKRDGTWRDLIQVASLSISDLEIRQYSDPAQGGSAGTYLAANFLDSLSSMPVAGTFATTIEEYYRWLGNQCSNDFKNVPFAVSDAMVNLMMAIDFWRQPLVRSSGPPRSGRGAQFYRTQTMGMSGPNGTLTFEGPIQHGHKQFFLGRIQPDASLSVEYSESAPIPALPSLLEDLLLHKSPIFELEKNFANDKSWEYENQGQLFINAYLNADPDFPIAAYEVFDRPFRKHPVHDLSEIVDTAERYLTHPEDKVAWGRHWWSAYRAVAGLRCPDYDMSVLSGLQDPEMLGSTSWEELAFMACKLRAILYRRIPRAFNKESRLYLFDVLHTAVSTGHPVEVNTVSFGKDAACRLMLALRPYLKVACWGVRGGDSCGVLAQILKTSNHRVTFDGHSARYEVSYAVDRSNPFDPRDYSEWSIVMPTAQNGDVVSIVNGFRMNRPLPVYYRVGENGRGRREGDFEVFDPTWAKPPVLVFQIQVNDVPDSEKKTALGKMTFSFRWESL